MHKLFLIALFPALAVAAINTPTTPATASILVSAGTIDGATSLSLDIRYMSITVVSDGSNWYIL